MKKNSNFKEALMDQLSNAKFSDKALKKYSNILADLNNKNFIIERVWWYGQPPLIDTVMASTRLKLDELNVLKELANVPGLKSIKGFPIGIVDPEAFDFHFQIDGPLQ